VALKASPYRPLMREKRSKLYYISVFSKRLEFGFFEVNTRKVRLDQSARKTDINGDTEEKTMNVKIQTQGFGLTPAIAAQVHKQVSGTLERYANDIIAVDVYLKDLNGPKGGEDKQAGIRVQLRHLAPITVISIDDDLYKAIGRSAKRTRRAVRRSASKFRRIRRRGLQHLAMAEV
jgi:ribosome-associated translation inhibitor RaiA